MKELILDISKSQQAYAFLQNDADENFEVFRTMDEIAEGSGIKNSMAAGSAISVLARGGYLERFDVVGKRMKGTRLKRPDVAAKRAGYQP